MTIEEKLAQAGQSHVLNFADRISNDERKSLYSQLESLDFEALKRMQGILQAHSTATAATGDIAPAPAVELNDASAKAAATKCGEEALRAGNVAIVLVAGGQGSRLGFDGPKGAYPIGPITNAPLFYFHARKILALSHRYGAAIPFYIMTSEVNDAATRQCFASNNFFGLDSHDVFFFKQGVWPALNDDGKIILDSPSHIFMSPDGHGGILAALDKSGAISDMEKRGITTVFYFQVDNPMVEVADPAFIGTHLLNKADISVKVCAKRDPQEGLGMMCVRDGHHVMVEYTELTEEQKNARLPDGELLFKFGSVAIHVFDFAFLKRETAASLPLHLAHKKIAVCDADGNVVKPSSPNGWKFEKFVFDVIPDAAKVLDVVFDRAEEFSPVKNAEGADSPATCKRDLQRKWARWFDECGIAIDRTPDGDPAVKIEIDPATAIDASALKRYLSTHSVDATHNICI